jgi:carboxylesterase
MIGAALGLLAAIAGVRAVYPRLVERRAAQRRRLGPDGIVVGAGSIDLARAGAPGVLLLHGGGDTPQALAGLATHLHAAGYAVRAPLMAHHGRSLVALREAAAGTWFQDALAEYRALRREHDWVALVGLSIGGAISARLAATLGAELPCLVLLAPYLDMPPLVRRIARTSTGWEWLLPYLPSGGQRSVHDPEAAARGLGHGIVTPAALRAFHETMRAGRDALPRVVSPTLMVQSREDNRIPAASADRAFARIGAHEKTLTWVEGSGHVITVDYGHERVFSLVADWLGAHRPLSSREPAPPGFRPGP